MRAPRPSVALLLSGLFLLGAGRSGRPVPPPEPVTTSHSPWDRLTPMPPFHGSAAPQGPVVDAVPSRFSFEADLSALEAIRDTKLLSQHLAADPRWRVTMLQGAFVALLRRAHGESWTVSRLGFHQHESGHAWRTLLRFTPWSQGHLWADAPTIHRVQATSSHIEVPAFFSGQAPWDGLPATALVVEAPQVELEVYEVGPPEPRVATQASLQMVQRYLGGIRPSAVEARGFDVLALPDAPQVLDPWVLLTVPAPNRLRIMGCADPGDAGWTWVRLVDDAGDPWSELPLAVATREMVGWGGEPGTCFPFESSLGAPTAQGFSGTAEIWFAPIRGGELRRLASYPAHFPAR